MNYELKNHHPLGLKMVLQNPKIVVKIMKKQSYNGTNASPKCFSPNCFADL
jgi:hypothetical protein